MASQHTAHFFSLGPCHGSCMHACMLGPAMPWLLRCQQMLSLCTPCSGAMLQAYLMFPASLFHAPWPSFQVLIIRTALLALDI